MRAAGALAVAVAAAGLMGGRLMARDETPKPAAKRAPGPATAADLSWMSGTWSCPRGPGEFHEHWMAPAGDAMVGVGRLVSGEKTRFMEFLSVEPGPDGLTMWIMLGAPSRGPKTGKAFKLTRLGDVEAVFENPDNGFPTRITYRRESETALLCRLEGTRNGQPATEDYPFRRAK